MIVIVGSGLGFRVGAGLCGALDGSGEEQIFSLYKLFSSIADSLKSECEANKLTIRIKVSESIDFKGQPL